jgi:hypothetical protein
MECYSCDMLCDLVVDKMYYEELRFINTRLNSDIVSIVKSFLYFIDGHDVIHDEKQLIDDSPGCDDYIEMRYTDTICTFCFQKGLALSLHAHSELPYLRKDFGYFCSDAPISGLKQQMKLFILPRVYSCTYYASSFMCDDNEDGLIYIKSNNKN